MNINPNRRDFMKMTGCCAGALALLGAPNLAMARIAVPQRLVVVQLRGGMDGLHVMPDYTSQRLMTMRGNLAVTPPIGNALRRTMTYANQDTAYAALDLNGRFGLHPQAAGFKRLYDLGEAMFAHGVRYNQDPSFDHFVETAKMANADGSSNTSSPGWVNRLAQVLGASNGTEALSLSSITALVPELQGNAPASVYVPSSRAAIPSGEQMVAFLRQIYANTSMLGLFNEGIDNAQATAMALQNMPGHSMQNMQRFLDPNALDARMQIGALLMMAGAQAAPNLLVFEDYGWDHHGGQYWNMPFKMRILSRAIEGMRDALSAQIDPATGQPYWANTTILVLSEFGRQINTNAGEGTDHGYGNAMFMFTGMNQSRLPGRGVAAMNWGNGLEGDMVQSNGGGNFVLKGTINGFDLLRGVLAAKFGLSQAQANEVFPVIGGTTSAASLYEQLATQLA